MGPSIKVNVPRRGIGSDLTESFARRGLHAEFVEDGEDLTLRVSFIEGEHDRLVTEAMHAVEDYLSEKMLPLVAQPTDGGIVVRPPAS